MNLYKKCTEKPYSFLVIDAALALNDFLRFRKNALERIEKLIMKVDGQIRDEKLQYYISREATKISALSSGKIDKHKFVTDKEILSSDQRRVIEKAKFGSPSLGKALEKQTKTIEDQGKNKQKQLKIMENNWLNLMHLLKRIVISTEIAYHLKNKKIFNKIAEERTSEFQNLEKKN